MAWTLSSIRYQPHTSPTAKDRTFVVVRGRVKVKVKLMLKVLIIY